MCRQQARAAGASVDIKRDLGCCRPSRKASYYKLARRPLCKIEELVNYDSIIVSAGTRFGRMASQMANFLDQAGGLWAKRPCTAGRRCLRLTRPNMAARRPPLFSIITNSLHFGTTIVGSARFCRPMKLDEVTDGAPYGATAITGGDGSRQPSENELAARYQGRVIAETASKLHS
jgi:NAD(P)H dehydrogenase (quinone)